MSDILAAGLETLDRCGAAMLEWMLWMNLWTGALLIVALVLDHLLRRRLAASWRLVLFLAVIARLFVPASLQSPIGAVTNAPLMQSVPVTTAPAIATAELAGTSTSSIPANTPGTRGPLTMLALVPIGYAAGVLALIVAWRRSDRRLRSIVSASRPVRGVHATALARAIPELDTARIREHGSAGPLLIGVLRPTLVLPSRLFTALGGETLAAVLRHEQAHLTRRDSISAALLHLLVIAAWPVVPVWLAASRIRTLIELACDERALDGAPAGTRADYGRALLAFASGRRAPSAALSFAGGLPERIAALREARRWHRAAQFGVVAPIAAVLVACAAHRTTDAPSATPMDGRLHPAVYRGATPEPHKGSHEVQFTVLEGVPLSPRLDELRAGPSGQDESRIVVLPSSEFDALLAREPGSVITRPRASAILGLPFSLEIGSSGPGGTMISGIAIQARIAMIMREPGDERWTYQIDLDYSESAGGATIAGPFEHAVSVHPGDTAVLLIPTRDGHADRLLCVAVDRATPRTSIVDDGAAPPTPQTSEVAGTAPDPAQTSEALEGATPPQQRGASSGSRPPAFDPLGGEYPQVLWMLNVYQVPGPVEIDGTGRVTTTTKAKPGTFASIGASGIDAVFASLEAIDGRMQLAAPALIGKYGVEAVVRPESRDKAGQALPNRSITIRAAPAEAGIKATFEATVSAGAFSVSTHVADRFIASGGAVVFSTPGPSSTDPWTVIVARPTELRSARDYPFQTATMPNE